MTGPLDLVSVGLDVGGDLGVQRRREHRPRTLTNDLLKQRRTGRVLVGRLGVMDYLAHRRTFPNQRSNAGHDQTPAIQIILGKVRSFASPDRGPSTGSDHCSRRQGSSVDRGQGDALVSPNSRNVQLGTPNTTVGPSVPPPHRRVEAVPSVDDDLCPDLLGQSLRRYLAELRPLGEYHDCVGLGARIQR
jgi:hypothetical protein